MGRPFLSPAGAARKRRSTAAPCIRQRLLPATAGDRQGRPDRVLAPHRGARRSDGGSRVGCVGSALVFAGTRIQWPVRSYRAKCACVQNARALPRCTLSGSRLKVFQTPSGVTDLDCRYTGHLSRKIGLFQFCLTDLVCRYSRYTRRRYLVSRAPARRSGGEARGAVAAAST